MNKIQLDPSVIQAGLGLGVIGIGVAAALTNRWDIAGLVLTGLLGALNLTPRPPAAPPQP